ncbi:MAG TPA: hypothetical protein VF662_06795 [Allosphingosinicella sp.]
MALAMVSTPAFAADKPKDKKICKRTDEGRTGTHLSGQSRICRTASEWRALEDSIDADLRRVSDKVSYDAGSSSPASGPSPTAPN